MARKKKADVEKTPNGYQVMIDDTIDEKPMTQEEREKAVQSLKDTVEETAEQVKVAINLSEVARALTDPAPNGFLDRMQKKTIEEPKVEQMQMQLDFPEDADKKESPAEPKPIDIARKAGALTSLNGHVATLANKELQYSFTSFKMLGLPGKHDDFSFDREGKLMDISLNGQALQPLDEIHTGFLMLLMQAANLADIREYNSMDEPSLALHLPSIFRESEIDPRKREREYNPETGKKELNPRKKIDEQTMKQLRLNAFLKFLSPLDDMVGIIEGEGYYTVARFIRWDEATDTAYIAIPFEIKLAELVKLHSDTYSAISTIFRANIVTENPTAVELANRIAVGVIERGVKRGQGESWVRRKRSPVKRTTTKTDAEGNKTTVTETFAPDPVEPVIETPKPRFFEYSARFSTLIDDCPQLKKEIEDIRNSNIEHKSQRVNHILRDVFAAAIRIIMEKSEMPDYYKDLKIRTHGFDYFKAPTNSTLKEQLIVTHTGKNPNFKPAQN